MDTQRTAAPCTACVPDACRCEPAHSAPSQAAAEMPAEPCVWMPWSAGIAANA